MPTVVSAPFSLAFRQDVVNAAVGVLLPPGELMVLLNYVVSLSMGQDGAPSAASRNPLNHMAQEP